MPNIFNLPELTSSTEPADLASGLRALVFDHQSDAARYFSINRSMISRYETEKAMPPLGYLAELMRLINVQEERKAGDDRQVEGLKQFFVGQIKKLTEFYEEAYRFQTPYRDWAALCEGAAKYLAARTTLPETAAAPPLPAAPSLVAVPVPPQRTTRSGPFLVPQLPVQGIFGREQNLLEINRLLTLDDPEAANVPPLALRGMGGIGKTTLARAVGHLPGLHERFHDGILWVELGPYPLVRLILNDLGRAIGIDLLPERDEAACQQRLQAALHDRRAVLIVDDIWDVNDGRYFQLTGPYGRTLFTTREPPIAHDLATRDRTVRVEVLGAAPALALLRRLAPEAVNADDKRARLLCERLEYLPLGLQLAGRLLANEADVPTRMSRLLGELTEQRQARLSLVQSEGRTGLARESVSIEAILGLSVDRLDQQDKERFAMLAVFGGEPYTWDLDAMLDVWACPLEQAEDSVARFIARGLVELQGDRYWMHALLADYAAEMLEASGL